MGGREKSKGGAPVWEVLIQTGAKDWVETDPSLLHISVWRCLFYALSVRVYIILVF